MSASLVGSEMCIRDRSRSTPLHQRPPPASSPIARRTLATRRSRPGAPRCTNVRRWPRAPSSAAPLPRA
eukprot:6830331-Alexandrium_andersonii.AAC.1